MAKPTLRSLTGTLQREVGRIVRRQLRRSTPVTTAPPAGRAARQPGHRPSGGSTQVGAPRLAGGYPGDFRGDVDVRYAPHPDGEPDPGEIVWAWVPYEEDHTQGKDRPVLLVGHDGSWLLGLQLTSQDNDRKERERRAGRVWVDIGSGEWDSRRRPSEARVDRILRIDPRGIRREGAVLAREVFAEVAEAVRAAAG